MDVDMVTKKKYYRVDFTLRSPLAIGSGENDVTDKDIIKDARGIPFIPATSIAGIIREKLISLDEKKAKEYLGDIVKNTGEGNSSRNPSCIMFYDGLMKTGSDFYISVRDSVALDDCKTAKDGAKFDMEILEPGVVFRTYIEQSFDDKHAADYGAEIARIFKGEDLFLGAKTMRGYGAIGNVNVKEIEFDLRESASVDKWLGFDLFGEEAGWKDYIPEGEKETGKRLVLSLKQRGGISIRRYTTKVSKNDETQPDSESLTLYSKDLKGGEIAVIPGTSWAGAFRHRMKDFGVDVEGKGSVFGFVKGEGSNDKARSRIRFSESQITDGKFIKMSRNAIDRFTGGTVDGALFTERSYYGGTTKLTISWNDPSSMPDSEQKALAATITDLHFGFLAVGGETSIGRGLFTVASVNGKDIPEATADNSGRIYEMILNEIREVF